MHAQYVRQIREDYAHRVRFFLAELAAIEGDEYVSEEGKAEKTAPILEKVGKNFDRAMADATTRVNEAVARMRAVEPQGVQRDAALQKPDRAAAIRSLATGASAADVEGMLTDLAARGDLAGAYGVRLALNDPTCALDDALKLKLAGVVNAIGAGQFNAHVAEVVAAQTEKFLLESGGPRADGSAHVFASPVAHLTGLREAAVVELSTGERRTYDATEQEAFCEIAGVPMGREQAADWEPAITADAA